MASSARSSRRQQSGDTTVGDGGTQVGGPDAAPPAADPTDVPTVDPVAAAAEAGAAGPENDAGMTAQDLAAQRRAERNTAPAEHLPGGVPPAAPGGSVLVSRAMIDGMAGDGSPGRPVGPTWQGQPIVLQNLPNAPGGKLPNSSLYVIAEIGASSSTVMPGCVTPVSRKEWEVGQAVRKDVYEAALAAHQARVAEGTHDRATPAQLPAGRDALPPDVVATGTDGTTSASDVGLATLSAPTLADRQG